MLCYYIYNDNICIIIMIYILCHYNTACGSIAFAQAELLKGEQGAKWFELQSIESAAKM